MGFVQFPRDQYFRIIDTDTVTGLGAFNLQEGTELRHLMLTIYQNGAIVTPYQARINVYGNNFYNTPIFQSGWITLSTTTLEPTFTTNWLGNIYFDFDGHPLNPNIDYFYAIETSGYTRLGDAFYLGVNLDWISEVNDQLSAPDKAGARIRLLGDRP